MSGGPLVGVVEGVWPRGGESEALTPPASSPPAAAAGAGAVPGPPRGEGCAGAAVVVVVAAAPPAAPAPPALPAAAACAFEGPADATVAVMGAMTACAPGGVTSLGGPAAARAAASAGVSGALRYSVISCCLKYLQCAGRVRLRTVLRRQKPTHPRALLPISRSVGSIPPPTHTYTHTHTHHNVYPSPALLIHQHPLPFHTHIPDAYVIAIYTYGVCKYPPPVFFIH